MKKALILVALSIFILFTACLSVAEVDAIKEYLADNHTVIDLNDKVYIDSLNFPDIDQYDVFLSGEEHTIVQGQYLNRGLLQYFHEKAGVRIHLVEIGFGAGILLQEYLDTGDQELLDFCMQAVVGTQAHNKEYEEFWQWLYEYNQGFPEDERILIFGVDIDHQLVTARKGLQILTEKSGDPNKSLIPVVKEIALKGMQLELFKEFKEAIEVNPQGFQEFFGENLPFVEQLISSIESCLLFYEGGKDYAKQDHEARESAMMDRFLFVYNLYEGEKFYGHFGGAHIVRKKVNNKNIRCETFAMRLESVDSPVAGRVCSIGWGVIDRWPKSFREILLEFAQGKDLFVSLPSSGNVLADPSTFFGPTHTGGVTSDYFQKLILITDPIWVTPYEQE